MSTHPRQTIFRHAGSGGHVTVLNNSMLRDKQLSLEARGALAIILSLPADWDFHYSWFMAEVGIGRDKLRGIVKELIAAGYCQRLKNRSSDGKIHGEVFVFYGEAKKPSADHQATEKPATGKPAAGKHPPLQREKETKGDSTKKDSCSAKLSVSDQVLNPEFQEWWKLYPRKIAKGAAWKAYCTARRKKAVSPAELLEGASRMAGQAAGSDPQFIPYPATWLNAEQWLDVPDSVSPTQRYATKDPKLAATYARWDAELARDRARWAGSGLPFERPKTASPARYPATSGMVALSGASVRGYADDDWDGR